MDTTTLQWYKRTPCLNPQKPKQAIFDFGVNVQRSLPPAVPQLRWDPWARHRTPNCYPGAAAIWLPTASGVCVFSTVCVHLDGLNAEHKLWVWVTISGHTSLHVTFTKCIYAWLHKSFYSRLFSEWGTSQGRFCYLKCEKNVTPFVILKIFISDCNLITHFFSVTDYNYFYL